MVVFNRVIGKDGNGIDIIKLIEFIGDDITFKLELRNRITVIRDVSGAGKTLIYNNIREYSNYQESNGGKREYIVISTRKEWDNLDKNVGGNVIVLDEADFILDEALVEYINNDVDNYYIITTRKNWELRGSINSLGKIKYDRESKTVGIEYIKSVPGW